MTSQGVSRGLSFSSTSVPKAARMLARRLRRASGDWGETSLIQEALNTKTCARVATAVPAFDEPLQLGIVGRDFDFDGHQLVPTLAILAHEATALEAQNLARRRPLGNRQHHRSFGRR